MRRGCRRNSPVAGSLSEVCGVCWSGHVSVPGGIQRDAKPFLKALPPRYVEYVRALPNALSFVTKTSALPHVAVVLGRYREVR